MTEAATTELLHALRLQLDWGADEALEDLPQDRLARPPAAAAGPEAAGTALAAPPGHLGVPAMPPDLMAPEAAQAPPARRAHAPAAPAAAVPPATRAAQIAAACDSTQALRAALAEFRDCPLAATATNLVFADGNPEAGLVFVGEAPGAEEDIAGLPFVGPSGKLLDAMLGSIGITRASCLITNVIPWRPPGNRTPTDAEVAMCLPFLRRHLQLLAPRIVVTLGNPATQALLERRDGIGRLHGKWHEVTLAAGQPPVALLPMYHPAYLLRLPGAKREAWADLLTLRKRLDQAG